MKLRCIIQKVKSRYGFKNEHEIKTNERRIMDIAYRTLFFGR